VASSNFPIYSTDGAETIMLGIEIILWLTVKVNSSIQACVLAYTGFACLSQESLYDECTGQEGSQSQLESEGRCISAVADY
jgi:hypothetical protein